MTDTSERPPAPARPALCIDLDGSLVRTDTLHEAFATLLATQPLQALMALRRLPAGRAALKAAVTVSMPADADTLPYREEVLDLVRSVRQAHPEQPVALVTAAHRTTAEAVARALPGHFTEIHASDGTHNLKGAEKARRLVERFGRRGFEYVGDAEADLPVWQEAQRAFLVEPTKRILERLSRQGVDSVVLVPRRSLLERLRAWLAALRPRQWLKNGLIFLAPMAAFALGSEENWLRLAAAFTAFCFLASAVYLINDVADISADRSHPLKRRRPLADGRLSPLAALAVAFGLAAAGLLLFASMSVWLAGLGLVYLVLCLIYNARLKHRRWWDVAALTAFYNLRVLAGAWTLLLPVTPWLIAFTTASFASLGALKRALELALRERRQAGSARARGYGTADLPKIRRLGIASGLTAAAALALYALTSAADMGYRQPAWLLAMSTLVAVAFLRIWWRASPTHHAAEQDDPIRHLMRDPLVWLLVGAGALMLMLAR